MIPIRTLLLMIATFATVHSQGVLYYNVCNDGTSCPSGLICNTNAPCKKGWCNQCSNSDDVPFYDNSRTFTCVRPTYKIGETGCKADSDCYDLRSYCDKTSSTTTTCKCIAGFQASNDGKMCNLQATVKLGASCSNSYQCGKNTQCSSTNGCQCISNFKDGGDGSNCVQYKVGDTCSSSYCNQLSTNCPGATCNSGSYQCLDSYIWVDQIQIGYVDAVLPRGSCIAKTATQNVASGKSCSMTWPYTAICDKGLMCAQCAENAYLVGTCVSVPVGEGKALRSNTLFAAAVAMTTWIIIVRLR